MHTVDDAAASGTERGVHSLHGYFLRAGRAHAPVIYQVDRTRDGGRFSTRRVIAIQGGEPIFHMECGFHAREDGFDHQSALPPACWAPIRCSPSSSWPSRWQTACPIGSIHGGARWTAPSR
ncbi:MAG: acyl-CoA thioesterase [Sandaracinobacter sp.]